MSQNPDPSSNLSPDQLAELPSPSVSDILAGAVLEMIEEQGLDPFGPASSPHERSTPRPQIPGWFRNLSDLT